MENQENNNGQLQIELKEEVAQGTYANLAIITHSSSEFILDFIRVMPGMPKAGVQSRIVLAPEHAKRLLRALEENIGKYERAFGLIRMPDPADGALRPHRHPPRPTAGPAAGAAGHRLPQRQRRGGARHLRRRAHRRYPPAFTGAGRPAGAAPPHGELRHLPHRRRRSGGQHGGIRGRTAPEAGLPPLPDPELRRSR